MSLCFVIGISFFLLPFTYCIQSMVHPGTSHSLNQCSWFTPPSVFSHPPPPTCHPRLFHLHPKYQPRITSLPTLLHICVRHARIFLSLLHTPMWMCVCVFFKSCHLFSRWCSATTLLGHTPPVIFHSHQVTPVLARSCPPANLAHVKLFWITAVCSWGVFWWSDVLHSRFDYQNNTKEPKTIPKNRTEHTQHFPKKTALTWSVFFYNFHSMAHNLEMLPYGLFLHNVNCLKLLLFDISKLLSNNHSSPCHKKTFIHVLSSSWIIHKKTST